MFNGTPHFPVKDEAGPGLISGCLAAADFTHSQAACVSAVVGVIA